MDKKRKGKERGRDGKMNLLKLSGIQVNAKWAGRNISPEFI